MRIVDPETLMTFVSKRRKRFEADRMPRELTFSCFRRYPFLTRDRTRNWFIEALEVHRQRWPIDLWSWVIMPEHVHLIVAPQESGVLVGRFAGSVKEHVARRAIDWLETNAPDWIPRITVTEGNRIRRRFWQPGGGYDRNIDDVQTLLTMIEYLHANPVRRGLVERAIDWEWSSARWYAEMEPCLLRMDATLPWMDR